MKFYLVAQLICHAIHLNSIVETTTDSENLPSLVEAERLLRLAGDLQVAENGCVGCPYDLSDISVLPAGGESQSQPNRTGRFLGEASVQQSACIQLMDVHPLWGGRSISIFRDGRACVQIVQPGHVERRFWLTLAPEEIKSLLETFITLDFVYQARSSPMRRKVIPDETYAEIILLNGANQKYTVGRLARDPARARFNEFCRALNSLAERTHGLEPSYTGPYAGLPKISE